MTEKRNIAGPICKNFCDGCPCLKTENKEQYIEESLVGCTTWGGYMDRWTVATCSLNNRTISEKYQYNTETPNWCPVIGK